MAFLFMPKFIIDPEFIFEKFISLIGYIVWFGFCYGITIEYIKQTFKSRVIQMQIKLCFMGLLICFFLGIMQSKKNAYDYMLIDFIIGFIGMQLAIGLKFKNLAKED